MVVDPKATTEIQPDHAKIIKYVLAWIDKKIDDVNNGKIVDEYELATFKMIVKFMIENDIGAFKIGIDPAIGKCPKCGIVTRLREPTDAELSTILFDKNGNYIPAERLKGFKACDGCLKTHVYHFYRSME